MKKYIPLLFLLSSCYVLTRQGRDQHAQKIVNQKVSRATAVMMKYDRLADTAHKYFPCKLGDSTVVLDSAAYLDELDYWKAYVQSLKEFRDTLIRRLNEQPSDSSCLFTLQAMSAAYNQHEAYVDSLLDHLPVVVKTITRKVADSSAIHVLQRQVAGWQDHSDSVQSELYAAQARVDTYKNSWHSARSQRNMAWWIVVLILVILFRKPLASLLSGIFNPLSKISWVASLMALFKTK